MKEEDALRRAGSYCATAERCKSDVREKLKKWETDAEAIERIIERLEKENYLSEERFCRAFVLDKFRFAKWGKLKIRQALSLKKISSSEIYNALDAIDEKEYMETLTSLIAAKKRSTKAKSDYELNGKLIRFALSRGFEMGDISKCLKGCDEYDV